MKKQIASKSRLRNIWSQNWQTRHGSRGLPTILWLCSSVHPVVASGGVLPGPCRPAWFHSVGRHLELSPPNWNTVETMYCMSTSLRLRWCDPQNRGWDGAGPTCTIHPIVDPRGLGRYWLHGMARTPQRLQRLRYGHTRHRLVDPISQSTIAHTWLGHPHVIDCRPLPSDAVSYCHCST